jgi:hypothetical protein
MRRHHIRTLCSTIPQENSGKQDPLLLTKFSESRHGLFSGVGSYHRNLFAYVPLPNVAEFAEKFPASEVVGRELGSRWLFVRLPVDQCDCDVSARRR